VAGKNLREVLQGTWYRAPEDDTAAEKGYRKLAEGAEIPPGRARDPFTLNPDGTMVEGETAANDARTEAEGTWTLDGDQLTFRTEEGDEAHRTMKIASVTKDRLSVKR
jgi:hypothetical protein